MELIWGEGERECFLGGMEKIWGVFEVGNHICL